MHEPNTPACGAGIHLSSPWVSWPLGRQSVGGSVSRLGRLLIHWLVGQSVGWSVGEMHFPKHLIMKSMPSFTLNNVP